MTILIGGVGCVLLLAVFSLRFHRTDSVRSALLASTFTLVAVGVVGAAVSGVVPVPETVPKSVKSANRHATT
jgi:hypothetical protein